MSDPRYQKLLEKHSTPQRRQVPKTPQYRSFLGYDDPKPARVIVEAEDEHLVIGWVPTKDFWAWLATVLLVVLFLFLAVPRVVGPMVEQRNNLTQTCAHIRPGTVETWNMLVTKNIGSCEIGSKANTIRGMTWIFLIIVGCGLTWLTYQTIEYGFPVDDLAAGGVYVLIGLPVWAAIAFVLLVWAIFWAFIIMIGIFIGIVATSGNK